MDEDQVNEEQGNNDPERQEVTFKQATQGNFLPIQVIRVVSWNTGTAGDVLALY